MAGNDHRGTLGRQESRAHSNRGFQAAGCLHLALDRQLGSDAGHPSVTGGTPAPGNPGRELTAHPGIPLRSGRFGNHPFPVEEAENPDGISLVADHNYYYPGFEPPNQHCHSDSGAGIGCVGNMVEIS